MWGTGTLLLSAGLNILYDGYSRYLAPFGLSKPIVSGELGRQEFLISGLLGTK
jgi:hypothetical protein